jgi:hypothetical protein
MIPIYLNDLHLDKVFAIYCGNVDQYILESTSDESIVDSQTQKISGFVTGTFGQIEYKTNKYYSVENPTGKPYALLQIDNGVIKSPVTKKCDCAIANDVSLCFVEFKANANSNLITTIEKNYLKAIDQLSTTIGFFDTYHKSKGVDFRDLRNVEAYICFKQGYPRSTSSQMYYRIAFAAANNGIPLSFVRKKTL